MATVAPTASKGSLSRLRSHQYRLKSKTHAMGVLAHKIVSGGLTSRPRSSLQFSEQGREVRRRAGT